MFDIHIEEFYKDCSHALLVLHQNFPRKTSLYVEDISGPDEPDEYGIHSKRYLACFGALIWLTEEGFIQYEELVRQEALDQCWLTSKALNMLTVSLKEQSLSREESQTIGLDTIERYRKQPTIHIIEHLLKHGTSTQLTIMMRHCITKYTAENEFTSA